MDSELVAAHRPGSIDQVVRYLEVWLGHRRNGMAWVEYDSDLARDLAIENLERYAPCAARVQVPQASTRFDWESLRSQIEVQAGLVHVTFSATIGSSAIPQRELGDFALAMNLDRDPIFALDYPQIWWLRKELAAAVRQRAPDFVSWVHLRMVLDETPSPRKRGGPVMWANVEPRAQLFDISGTKLPSDALGSAEGAVRKYRDLVQGGHDDLLPDFARSLNTLAIVLSGLGWSEKALAAEEEAARIYRRLVDQRPESFVTDLTMCLNNLALMLSDLGRREEALALAEEAVRTYQELAQGRADALLPDLAQSLAALGNIVAADRE